jgi:four helix bundle protein
MENSKNFIKLVQKNSSKYHPLADQITHSAISVPSNIAEGQQRNTKLDFQRLIHISKGSNAELQNQLILAKSFIDIDSNSHIDSLILTTESVSKMLFKLIQSLK